MLFIRSRGEAMLATARTGPTLNAVKRYDHNSVDPAPQMRSEGKKLLRVLIHGETAILKKGRLMR
jgi:hypothetical protein